MFYKLNLVGQRKYKIGGRNLLFICKFLNVGLPNIYEKVNILLLHPRELLPPLRKVQCHSTQISKTRVKLNIVIRNIYGTVRISY